MANDDIAVAPVPHASRVLAWVYHLLAVAAMGALVVLLYDLRAEFRRTSGAVNQFLPEILAKTERSADTLAQVSDDIRQLRDLAGATGPRDATLATFADEILDRIEISGAPIGVEALVGKDLKDPVPAQEWTAQARKEALYLTFAAKSRAELLERLTKDKFGREWMIQVGSAAPVKLRDWLGAPGAGAATRNAE